MAVEEIGIVGRYRLGRSIGAGGMGRVWLAHDEMLGREVALKELVLPSGLSDNERTELRQRTLREARAAARLNHPNVVKIYDVVNSEAQSWIVMEYVRSRSLLEIIDDEGPLPPAEVARIGLAVLSALKAANRVGVLHRDVKPSNVLIAEDGRVVLTDFGSAIYDGTEGKAITRTGVILGSPQYIAPERARSGTCTAESDLWSLGASLYAAVEGRAPYHRATAMGTLIALATERPDPILRAGPLKPVLAGLLRKNPRARMGAAEVEWRLRKIAGSAVPAPRPAPDPDTTPDTGSDTGSKPGPDTEPTPEIEARPPLPSGGRFSRSDTGGIADRARTVIGRRPWRWAALGLLAALVVVVVASPSLRDGTWLDGSGTATWGQSAPSESTSGGLPAPPAGFAWWYDPSGYRVAVPKGWEILRESGAAVLFRDPDAAHTLRVRSLAGSDAEPGAPPTAEEDRPALAGYRRIRMETLAQNSATEWEYTFDGPSGRLHGLERVFVIGGQAYVVQWRTPEADWHADLPRLRVVVDSFHAPGG